MRAATRTPEVEILLVEDNEADIELTKLAFKEEGLDCHLSVTRNGAEAMDYLRVRAVYTGYNMPSLVLLDLNMPRMGGKQVLEAIRKDPRLTALPVMLLTSSQAHHDINDCFHLRANGYIVKPSGSAERATMVKRIAEFLNGAGTDIFLTH